MNETPWVVHVDDVAPQPWKNGGGMTRELLTWPSAPHWMVRVSVADIEKDGPFSSFPGVQRWFVVLKGAGVALDFADGDARVLRRGDAPLPFDGASAPGCRLLSGPTRDLNLMLRGIAGQMQMVADGSVWTPCAAACGLFTAVAGTLSIGAASSSEASAAGSSCIELPPYAWLWFDTAPPWLRFTAGQRPAAATGWWIAVAPSAASTTGAWT